MRGGEWAHSGVWAVSVVSIVVLEMTETGTEAEVAAGHRQLLQPWLAGQIRPNNTQLASSSLVSAQLLHISSLIAEQDV